MNGPPEGPGNNSGDAPGTPPRTITEGNRHQERRTRRKTREGQDGQDGQDSQESEDGQEGQGGEDGQDGRAASGASAARGPHARRGDFRAAFNAAQLPMAVVDRDGRVLSANRALGSLLGTRPQALTSTPVADLTGLRLDERVRAAYHDVLQGRGERMSCTSRLKHADGHTLWAEITVTTTARRGESLLSVTDITERRDLQERLRHHQMHDPVTRLPNRTLFFERLSTALGDTATGRIGICYLDLDGFKAVNDTLGHRIGDELLVAVARRITQCAEDCGGYDEEYGGGHLVARLGGDEFALLVESSTGTEQMSELAQSLLAALQRPFDLAGQRLAVSASIGVVEREAEGTGPTELMQAADTTLYWAKADGKARWTLFDPERNAHRMTRQELSSTLRRGVEHGEFVVEYQPIVGFADDALRGVEALVRWRHPRFGTLGPNQFIGLAEENGAIVPLGRWVLAESCRQARRWMLEHPGPPLFVSVNVAVRQVWDSDLVADVARILDETGLPSGLLQLELTESAVMGSAGRPLQALQALSEMGVRIAIDDFGTGYSNLAYLSRLPVRALKLDGSFVRGFRTARHTNPADETIVAALVQLAHKLGLTVTAECVEGPAQAERLRRIGCDTGQGWHYAKPMPAERIDALLR
ncbi:putative bifunctional diguanylate cyclase/phosphodiesterase [Streptomyces daliensis]|uniref:EAL domain-containing protein n=1 Tax=Streptomyces daliensis TaxID=299421 RepID=A0A8T4IUQ2_9ACTN|nr:EAL domain-containing protein [Streptomyces daliensis]